jgi:thymidylate synthase
MAKLPQLVVVGDSLPEVWEKSMSALFQQGIRSHKESYRHDEEKIEVIEASMKMVIRDPLGEPMLHMGCEGLGSLREYVDEVLDGTKDDYVDRGFWDYTYHRLLRNYEVNDRPPIDQVKYIIEKLDSTPFSNRAQATTWMPWKHPIVKGPPCLQRIWCKKLGDELEMHTSWRSRDSYNAAFMNMYAIIQLQKRFAEKIGARVGQYVDDSDSYHIYSYNIKSVEKFLETAKTLREKGGSPYEDSSLLIKMSK